MNRLLPALHQYFQVMSSSGFLVHIVAGNVKVKIAFGVVRFS